MWNKLTSLRWTVLFDAFSTTKPIIHAVDAQTEASRAAGTLWSTIHQADQSQLESLLSHDPNLIHQRGPVGELALHMCFLYQSEAHKSLARYIMKRFPSLISSTYIGDEYNGENILHIAIINQDQALVQELVSLTPSLLQAQAIGRFFSPPQPCYYGGYPLLFAASTNQLDMFLWLIQEGDADMNVEDIYGNNLLHLMVIHGLQEMYVVVKKEWCKRYGIEKGGEERERNNSNSSGKNSNSSSNSNSGSSHRPVELWKRLNKDKLTPMTLSAKLGSLEMFSFLLEEEKQMQWSYGPVSCYLYPLAQVDLALQPTTTTSSSSSSTSPSSSPKLTPSPSSSPSSPSSSPPPPLPPIGCLELIVNEAHLDLLMHPRIIDLVQKKWNRFASTIFFQRFVAMFFYLIIFSATTIVRQTANLEKKNRMKQEEETVVVTTATVGVGNEMNIEEISVGEVLISTAVNIGILEGLLGFIYELYSTPFYDWSLIIAHHPTILYVGESIVLLGALYKAYKEAYEIYLNGTTTYFSACGSAYLENILSLLFSTCMFGVVILALLDSPAERAVLALASITGWTYIFFFLLAFRLTGPMVVMIYQMLTNDVLRFCAIYSVFLFAFSQAFFVLFDAHGIEGYIDSFQSVFLATLGDFEIETFSDTPYMIISVSLLVFYVVVVTILLLNLLIAMMGDTYGRINENSEKQWHLERARIIFSIEHEMSTSERKKSKNKYWTDIDGERFLQVMVVNPDHFRKNKDEEEGEEEGGGGGETKEEEKKTKKRAEEGGEKKKE